MTDHKETTMRNSTDNSKDDAVVAEKGDIRNRVPDEFEDKIIVLTRKIKDSEFSWYAREMSDLLNDLISLIAEEIDDMKRRRDGWKMVANNTLQDLGAEINKLRTDNARLKKHRTSYRQDWLDAMKREDELEKDRDHWKQLAEDRGHQIQGGSHNDA